MFIHNNHTYLERLFSITINKKNTKDIKDAIFLFVDFKLRQLPSYGLGLDFLKESSSIINNTTLEIQDSFLINNKEELFSFFNPDWFSLDKKEKKINIEKIESYFLHNKFFESFFQDYFNVSKLLKLDKIKLNLSYEERVYRYQYLLDIEKDFFNFYSKKHSIIITDSNLDKFKELISDNLEDIIIEKTSTLYHGRIINFNLFLDNTFKEKLINSSFKNQFFLSMREFYFIRLEFDRLKNKFKKKNKKLKNILITTYSVNSD